MELIDFFAGQALVGLSYGVKDTSDPDFVAEWSYKLASAMLKQRAQISESKESPNTSTNSVSDEIATLKAEVEWLKGEFKVLKEMFEFYVRCCGDVPGFHL